MWLHQFHRLLTVLALTLAPAQGGYLISTPSQWISDGGSALVCVVVQENTAAAGILNIKITTQDNNDLGNETFFSSIINIPAGRSDNCHELLIPATDKYSGQLLVWGSVGGSQVNKSLSLNIKSHTSHTFLQTDKYVYKPGQKVQFRALTVAGPELKVSTLQYPEIWLTAPSRIRIAQWKNVDNSAGIIHLHYQLPDEPQEGMYKINVKAAEGNRQSFYFKVEEFVLPRYQVTIQTPPYILAIDHTATFTVCANYTFGQPVNGNLSFTVTNSKKKKCKTNITTNVTITGCAEVEISLGDLHVIDCYVHSVQAKAIFTEAGTGVQLEASATSTIERTAVKFKTIYKDSYVKPNLPYELKVRAERPDGSVAVGVPVEVCAAGHCNNMTTAEGGLFTIFLTNYDSYSIRMKALNCRASMSSSEFSESLNHYFSPSNSSLAIQVPEAKLKCALGQDTSHVLHVHFSARNQPSAQIFVQVISRGQIQYSSSEQYQLVETDLSINPEHMVEPLPPPLPGTIRGILDINVNILATASPSAWVLVWYTREDGEVVSDSRELKMEKCLPHTVSLTWSTPRAQPGDEAAITLKSEPESLCSLGVVDRSTELLAVDPDPINLNKMFDFLHRITSHLPWSQRVDDERYCRNKHTPPQDGPEIQPVPHHRDRYYSNYVDALKMFNDAHMIIFTDYTVETRPCEKEKYEWHMTLYDAPLRRGGGMYGAGGPQGSPENTRTNFPETWLWDLLVIPASGVREQTVTVPDTITQWMGKAVCVHPQKGVGLSERQPLITFTPFFVDLTLPPTVKRGEVLPVKMSVFNYLDQALPVSLTLADSPEYEILEEEGVEGERGRRITCIPPQDKTVIIIKIKPMEIGDVNITVAAVVDQQNTINCGVGLIAPERSDALIKPIKVEAEGFLRENTWTKYICAQDLESGDDSLETWELSLPETLVEGSARGWVTAVGDLLALSLENLGHLIRMPYGCGEQNMLNFAPNIYILRYLKATNQVTPEAQSKLISFMITGYRRELLYLRNDGSYSAFGNADDTGSTWLTAFVLKSFSQAGEYIKVDEEYQNQTSQWLQQQQKNVSGCFESVGKLLRKEMQGGVSTSQTPAPLTAYVMAALLEAGADPTSSVISESVKCLATDTSLHPYTLALKAYALVLAHHPLAAAAVQQLMDQAVVAKNSTHWELPRGIGKNHAVALETAAYGVLAMMAHDPVNMKLQARKVIKWITAQRNGQGGFYSTQDTVVALQALAAYESHDHQGPLNVQATMTGDDYSHTFTVNEDNKLVQQMNALPHMPTSLTLTFSGQGCAVLQAVQRYNIPEPEPSDAFRLMVTTSTEQDNLCITKRISVCASYRLSDGKSNMVVMEVDLITGYIPEKEDLKQIVTNNHNIKRYEVDGSKVTFYVDEITARDTCVLFRVLRQVDMEEVKEGTVIVYDYYQPEFKISKRYSLPPPEECQ